MKKPRVLLKAGYNPSTGHFYVRWYEADGLNEDKSVNELNDRVAALMAATMLREAAENEGYSVKSYETDGMEHPALYKWLEE